MHKAQSNKKKKKKKEGWIAEGKKGRKVETPALRNPIFGNNMLPSGLQD